MQISPCISLNTRGGGGGGGGGGGTKPKPDASNVSGKLCFNIYGFTIYSHWNYYNQRLCKTEPFQKCFLLEMFIRAHSCL